MTDYHVRYGGHGVMIHWHVEKKSVCIYSQLKSCSASEVSATIEAVLRHSTDASIDRQYTDTHGQNLVGFAFAHLLGFKLLPRMKNVADQKLARVDAEDPVPDCLAGMVSDKVINWSPSSTTRWSSTRPRLSCVRPRPSRCCVVSPAAAPSIPPTGRSKSSGGRSSRRHRRVHGI